MCRTYGAVVLRYDATQRLRAGLTYGAPAALKTKRGPCSPFEAGKMGRLNDPASAIHEEATCKSDCER